MNHPKTSPSVRSSQSTRKSRRVTPVRRPVAPLAGSVATLFAAAAFSGVLSPCAHAASATWTVTTNGAWSTGGNWSGGSPASGAGNMADFSTLDLTSDVTVTLDSAQTIGRLVFGDTTPSNNWVLSGTGSNILTLDNTGGSGAPTIQVNNQTATIGAVLAGTAGFIKSGAGTLVLSGSNTFTGVTAINAGTLSLSNSNALAGGGNITFGGGTLQFSASNTKDYSAKIVNSTGAISVDTNGQNVTFASALVVSNTGGLTKLGAGTLTLTAANTYTGVTNINAGTLTIGAGGSTSAVNSIAVNSGGTLAFGRNDTWGGNDTTTSAAITVNAGGTLASGGWFNTLWNPTFNSGTVVLNGGYNANYPAFQFCGTLTVTNSSSVVVGTGNFNAINIGGNGNATLTVATPGATDSLTVNAPLQNNQQGSKIGALTKTGSGTLVLSGSDPYTGVTTINGGTLNLSNSNALAGGGNITFGGGTLQFSASNSKDYSAKIVNSAGAISVDTNGQNVTFASALVTSNTGGLTKLGSGTLALSAANSFSGVTTASAGTLQLGNNLALQNSIFNTAGAGTLDLSLVNTPTLAGLTGAGALTPASNVTTLTLNPVSGTVTFSGALGGTANLIKAGTGTQVFSGANTYGGGSTINTGILEFSGTASMPATGTVTVNNGGVLAVAVGGPGQFTAGTSGAGTVGGLLSGTGGQGAAVTWNSGAAVGIDVTFASGTYAGVIANNGANVLGLTTLGANTLTLAGANTYTGATTISGGALNLTGTLQGSNIVNSGAFTESGAGAINGAGVTFTNSAGVATLSGSNTYGGGSTISGGILEFTGTTSMPAAGTVTVNNGGVLAVAIGGAGQFTTGTSGAGTIGGLLSGTGGQGSPVTWNSGAALGIDTASASGTYAGIITNSGTNVLGLNKLGANTLTLTASNTFTGATTVSAGTLKLQGNAFSGTARTYSIGSGATLDMDGGSPFATGTTTIIGSGTLQITNGNFSAAVQYHNVTMALGAGGLIDVESGASITNGGWSGINWTNNLAGLYLNGTLDMWNGNTVVVDALTGSGTATDTTSTVTLQVGVNNGSGVFNGSIADGSGHPVALLKSGTGVQILSGSNRYSSTTTINAGTLQIGNSGTTGLLSGSTAITGSTGATLAFNRSNALTVSNTISGGIRVLQTGSGVTILSGSNSYSGGSTINAGILEFSGTASMPVSGTVSVNSGCGLAVAIGGAGQFTTGTSGAGTVGGLLGGIGGQGSSVTWNSGAALGIDTTSASGTYGGVIANTNNGANVLALTKLGTNTLVLSGSNSYTGATTVAGGTLKLQGGAFSTTARAYNVSSGALLDLDGASPLAAGTTAISGSGTLQITNGTLQAAGTSSALTMALGSGGVIDVESGGQIVNGGSKAINWTNNLAGLYLNGGTLDLVDGNTVAVNALTGGGTVTNSSTGLTTALQVGVNNGSGTFSGVITEATGHTALIVSGTGVQILSGSNSYTGATTINAGTLQIGAGGSTGSLSPNSAISGSAGATLAFNRSNQLTQGTDFSNGIGGGLALLQSGSGTTILSGTNTYSGGSTINAGVLEFTVPTAMPASGTVTVNSGGALAAAVGGAGQFTMGTSGAGTIGGLLSGTGGQGTPVTWNSGAALGIDTTAASGTYAAIITNSGTNVLGLNKLGTNTLVLSGSNTYTGTTTVSAGTLKLQGLAFSGTSRNYSIASGAMLDVDGAGTWAVGNTTIVGSGTLQFTNGFIGAATSTASLTMALGAGGLIDVESGVTLNNGGYQRINWAGNLGGLYLNGGTLEMTDGNNVVVDALTGSGTVTLTSWASTPRTLQVGVNGGSGVFNGTITQGNGYTTALTKSGTGVQTLAGTTSYTGTTTINAGTLQIGNGGTTGSLSGSTAISGSTGATLAFNRSNTLTVSNTISGGIGVLQSGSGVTILSGSNSYSGGSTINAGILEFSGTVAMPASGTVTVNSGGCVAVAIGGAGQFTTGTTGAGTVGGLLGGIGGQGSAVTWNSGAALGIDTTTASGTYAGVIANNGSNVLGLTKLGTNTLVITNSNTYTGATVINTGILQIGAGGTTGSLPPGSAISGSAGATLAFNRSNTLTQGGDFSNTIGGGLSLVQLGSGTASLTGSNSYTGTTTVNAGTLQANNASALGSGGNITFGGGTLQYTSASAGQDWSARFTNSTSAAISLDTNGQSVTLAGPIDSSNTGGLVKIGAGTLTLTGSIAYSGTTGVNGGTLQFGDGASNTTITTGTTITVNSGATLAVNLANSGTFGRGIFNSGTVNLLNSGTNTIAGNIGGWVGTSINQSGSGTTILTGNNTCFSTFNINAGTVMLNYQYAGADLTFNQAVPNSLAFGVTNPVIGALSGTNGVNLVTTSGSGVNLSIGYNNFDSTYAGVIAGSGTTSTLTKTGTCTVTLTGSNSYGGATVINTGTLQIGNGGTTGSLPVGSSISGSAGGTIAFDQSNALNQGTDFSNTISGGVGFLQLGSGTTTLTGSNTYTGTTTVNGGRLVFIDNRPGGCNFTVGAGGTLEINTNATALGFNSGTISGNGTFVKSGSNILNFGTGSGGENISMTGGLIDVEGGALQNNYQGGNWTNNKASLKVAAGATVDLWDSPGGITVDALSGSGTVTHTTWGNTENFTVGVNNGSGNFGGTITNQNGRVLNLVKSGTGTQILSGTNTYQGTTTINAGTLQIGNGGGTGLVPSGSAVSGSNGATLAFNLSGSVTVANSISGGLGLVQLGSGTTSLTGSNSYTGTTMIDAGTLQAGNAAALGSGGNIAFGGGTLQYTTASAGQDWSARFKNSTSGAIQLDTNGQSVTLAGIIDSSNTGGLVNSGSGTLTLAGNSNYTGTTTVNIGTLNLTGTLQVSNIVNSATFTESGAGAVNGAGVTFTNVAGAATLSGSNNYNGGSTINGGVLEFTAPMAMPVSGTVTVNSGGALAVAVGGAGQFTTGTSGAGTVGGLLSGTGGQGSAVAWNSGAALGIDTTAASGTYAAVITDSGTNVLGLTKLGANTLFLSGSNTYTGGSTINGGILEFTAPTAMPVSGTVTVNNGGTLAVPVGGAGQFTLGTSGAGTIGGLLSGTGGQGAAVTWNSGAALGIDTTFASGTYSNVIANSGTNVLGLTKLGANTLTLTGSNTYTGTTTVTGGTLKLQGVAFSGTSRAYSIGSGAVLNVDSASSLPPGTTTITGSGTLQITNENFANTVGYSCSMIMALGSAGLIDVESGAKITNGGWRAITWTGNLAGLYLNGGTLDLWDGYTVMVDALTGNGTVTDTLNTRTLQVGVNNGSGVFNGTITDGGLHVVALIKSGTGVQTLSGTNSYSGTTTINAGTLQIGTGGTTGSLLSSTVISGSTGGMLAFNRSDTVTVSNTMSGGIGLAQLGSGTLSVTGSNSYTGTTGINAGTLQAGQAAALGNGGNISFGGGTLQYTSAIAGLDWSARFKNSTTGAIRLNTNGQSVTLAGTIDSSNTGGLTKSGSGTLTLSGSNSYSGGTTVSSGSLQIGNANALGTGGLTVNGGTLDLNGNSVRVAAFAGAGASALVTNSVSGTSTLTTAAASGTSTYAGNIADGAGAVVLTNSGAGTLILSGSLSMTGLNANGGVTQLTQSGSIGAVSVGAGATVALTANTNGNRNVLNVSSLTISGFTSSFASANTEAIAGANYTKVDAAAQQNAGVLTDAGRTLAQAAATGATEPASPESVPEPGTLGMLLAGALGLLGFRRTGKGAHRA